MLDVGWSELLIIGLVALVVVGPKELPGLMRTIGAFVAKAKETAYSFQRQFQEAVDESDIGKLKSDVEELQKDLSPEGMMGDLNEYGPEFEDFDPDEWNKSILEEEGKNRYRPPSSRRSTEAEASAEQGDDADAGGGKPPVRDDVSVDEAAVDQVSADAASVKDRTDPQ